jgi:hypothetical protein
LRACLDSFGQQLLECANGPVLHAHAAGRGTGLILLGISTSIAPSRSASTRKRGGARYVAARICDIRGIVRPADMLTLALPSAAAALWWHGRRGPSAGAWATWALAASMATLASVGYASLHISGTAAGRAAIVTTAAEASNQRATAIETAKGADDASTMARRGVSEAWPQVSRP